MSVIEQDRFTLPGHQEASESYDHALLLRVLHAEMQDPTVLMIMIDGFRCLHSVAVCACVDFGCWLELSYTDAIARKVGKGRYCTTPMFQDMVWPAHMEYSKQRHIQEMFDSHHLILFPAAIGGGHMCSAAIVIVIELLLCCPKTKHPFLRSALHRVGRMLGSKFEIGFGGARANSIRDVHTPKIPSPGAVARILAAATAVSHENRRRVPSVDGRQPKSKHGRSTRELYGVSDLTSDGITRRVQHEDGCTADANDSGAKHKKRRCGLSLDNQLSNARRHSGGPGNHEMPRHVA